MDRNKVIEEIKQLTENSFVLAYFYDKVCIGRIENNEIIFNEDINYNLLTQIRIFNDTKEIRYVMDETVNQFQKTIIDDSNMENTIVIDEDMYINENVYIPQSDNISNENNKNNLRLNVRNYYKEDKNNQLVWSNSRLVSIGKEE